jgi:hypothetical protein
MKFAYFRGGGFPGADAVRAWAKRLVDDLNKAPDPLANYPTYADDTAAETGGLPIGAGYVTAAGVVHRRMS